eukprot:2134917-Amphidinium_carterae.1
MAVPSPPRDLEVRLDAEVDVDVDVEVGVELEVATGRSTDMGTRRRRSRVGVVMVAVGVCPVGCSAQAADGLICPVRHMYLWWLARTKSGRDDDVDVLDNKDEGVHEGEELRKNSPEHDEVTAVSRCVRAA